MAMNRKRFEKLKKLTSTRKEFEKNVEKVTGKKFKDLPFLKITNWDDLRI